MKAPKAGNDEGVVVVNSSGDIRRVIQEFLPGKSEDNPVVSAEFMEGNQKVSVSAPTSCTYREMLVEGFNMVKIRMDAMAKCQERAERTGIQPIQIEGHIWLDDLISRRLGGKRDGLRIRWDLAEGIFYFDPYTGKLTKSGQPDK